MEAVVSAFRMDVGGSGGESLQVRSTVVDMISSVCREEINGRGCLCCVNAQ